MRVESGLALALRLVCQPTTMILALGSLAAVLVSGSFKLTKGHKSATAADVAVSSTLSLLKVSAASQPERFPQSHAPANPAQAGKRELPDVATMTARLEARLAHEPDDADGWRLLGLSRRHLDDPAGAAVAYAHALELRPHDAELTSALGEARRAAGLQAP